MVFISLKVLPLTPSLPRPRALPRTLTHGTPSSAQECALSADVRGSRRLLRLEGREGPWHHAAFSEESTTLTKMVKEALIFGRENLSARRDERYRVGKCSAGRAVGRGSCGQCACAATSGHGLAHTALIVSQ